MPRLLLQALNESDVAATLGLVFLVQIVLAVSLGIWIARDARKRGMRVAPWTLALVFAFVLSFLAGFIVFFLYLSVRSPPNPLMPPPGGQVAPPGATPWASPPAYAPAPRPGTPQAAPAATAASKVRCPRCQTVFEFTRQPQGLTQVKCPSCGMEGTI